MASSNHSSVPAGFKEVPGYDGKYFIDEQGRVWSCFKNRILTQHLDSPKNYLQSLMMMPGKKSGMPRYIHKLVAYAWLDSPPGDIGRKRGQYCVNHKDGNKLNNHVSNLEWITCDDNTRHAWQNGLNTQIGETSTSSKLSSNQVRTIRLRLINGEAAHRIAKEYNVSKNCIEKLRMYCNWKHQDRDLIGPMMDISNSITLKKFHESLQMGVIPASAYEEVEQIAPDGVVIEMKEFKEKRELFGHWYYQI
jgi:hypothetical protein